MSKLTVGEIREFLTSMVKKDPGTTLKQLTKMLADDAKAAPAPESAAVKEEPKKKSFGRKKKDD